MSNFTFKPPPREINASLIHKISEFYKEICLLGSKIPKRARLGIYLKIENICLDVLTLIITAALENKSNKFPLLNSARIRVEILKRLFRIGSELEIIELERYIQLELRLQEISKIINGWIKYIAL